ncbi:MAG: glycosyltransferase family 9 protein [Alphaproteobacteria bacterium]
MNVEEKILIIKLSAFGDFIQATGPFKAIRQQFPQAHITLMTTKPYYEMAKKCKWFDEIVIDERPKWFNIKGWFKTAKIIKKYQIVYDLQTSKRTNRYFYIAKLLGFQGDWSGIAKGCKYPHSNSKRDFMHTVDRQKEQLQMAGIKNVPVPDISWFTADVKTDFNIKKPYVLLVPGGAKHRPQKRWTSLNYAELAKRFLKKAIVPVIIGGDSERESIDIIIKECPDAISLMGKTKFEDIADLAREAVLAVGNDTGPMHLIAAAKTPCLVLFSSNSNPDLCRPYGDVKIMQKDDLNNLTCDEVDDFLEKNFSFS